MSPQELKAVLQAGLLSFPLTDFDAELKFAAKPYADRLEWLQPYGASALFAAGGTGEFFSLEPGEYSEVIQVALDTCTPNRNGLMTPLLSRETLDDRREEQFLRLRDRIEQCASRKFQSGALEGSPRGIILRSIDFRD